ncbi:hypothetical protein A4D02_25890 [Niastella koreensis]|uniref:Uncharacterized protein n=2 Tax=Niastella koreensis TaxID=354356 RepID=G8TM61_NIAKG|nr:hypothetical protein [Niastella koreensis]AEV99834.1 hypothetical protein Niako_3533 [Niastella koreensis GR20-10]OQP51549.1 hypothetical protein A4D02_25890 [Niastella koreensis]
MNKNILVVAAFLVCVLMVVPGFSQDNQWLRGAWKGEYFGEKSKLTKTFDTRLLITKMNGAQFEGVVQCILPSDTTVRLHTRITGRIYDHYIMTKLKEVVYFKDPPGHYTWAKHCNKCDSMKYTFEQQGDSIIIQGERRCDTLCNIVARYSRNIGSLVYKPAFLYDPAITPRKLTAKTAGSTAAPIGAITAGAAKPAALAITTSTSNNSNTASTTSTANTGINFVKPVYKDSLVGRNYFAGRAVSQATQYVLNADSVEIRFMDNGVVDGDTISVYYNGQLLVSKLCLKEQPYIIKVPLYPGYPNRLVIYAESLGIYPPNTAYVRILYGKKEQSFLLSSTMSKSGSIELYTRPPATGGGVIASH